MLDSADDDNISIHFVTHAYVFLVFDFDVAAAFLNDVRFGPIVAVVNFSFTHNM